MRIAIAGSRALKEGTALRLLQGTISTLSNEDTVLLRSPMGRGPENFERDVAALVGRRHGPVGIAPRIEWRKPAPTERHPGRASVYLRDYEMIEDADQVLLFFTPEDAATGYSGTAHLLDKALDAGVPVTAYSVYEDGSVVRIGEIEPE